MMLADAMSMHLNIQPLDSASVDEIAEGLESKITALVDKHAPFKSDLVRPTRKPWITKELLKLIFYKNRMFKTEEEEEEEEEDKTMACKLLK